MYFPEGLLSLFSVLNYILYLQYLYFSNQPHLNNLHCVALTLHPPFPFVHSPLLFYRSLYLLLSVSLCFHVLFFLSSTISTFLQYTLLSHICMESCIQHPFASHQVALVFSSLIFFPGLNVV